MVLKRQIGIWVDAVVWQAYRDLCGRERLRPAEPIEGFLGFVLRNGSAIAVLNMLQGMGKAEGFEAHVRVLLEWYKSGKLWMYVTDGDQAPVESMLLQSLKDVADPQLRGEIEEALKKAKKQH